MKSNCKKILSVVLALIMLLSICVPTFAASAEVQRKAVSVNVTYTNKKYYNRERMPFNAWVKNHAKVNKDVTIKVLHTSFIHTNADNIEVKNLAPGEKRVVPFFATAYRNKLPSEKLDNVYKLVGGKISVAFCKVIAFLSPSMKCMTFKVEDSVGAVAYSIDVKNSPAAPQPEPPASDEWKVTFDSNGGSAVAAQNVKKGTAVAQPEDPVKEGYRLVAWYKNAELTEVYDFTAPVNANITLYAKWEKIESGEESFLDKPAPEVEFYRFNVDTIDILVGAAKTVTFKAEIFAEIELGKKDIAVVDDDNNVIGYMTDDGANGDETAQDGIYTLKVDLSSDTEKLVNYHAKYKNINSQERSISFYKEFTAEDLANQKKVAQEIEAAAAPYVDADGNVIEGKLDEGVAAVIEKAKSLKAAGLIKDYKAEDSGIHIELNSGATYLYMFHIKGTDSGTIKTYQPYKDTYDESLQGLSNEATDGSARKIVSVVDGYAYSSATAGNEYNTTSDDNYDGAEVNLATLEDMESADIILWHGHGGYSETDKVSFFGIGISNNDEFYHEHSSDFRNKRLYVSTNGNILVTGRYIRDHLTNMEDKVVYMGTCSSARDEVDGYNPQNATSIVDGFLENGAKAVIGNTATIHTEYNAKMERDTISGLCKKKENGTYYTLSEALAYAKKLNGEKDTPNSDGVRAEVKLFSGYGNAGNNYRLEEANVGKLVGNVKNAKNNSYIANALIRIYDTNGNEIFGKGRTNANGNYSINNIPEGEYVIEVSAGSYKSAKMKITITANKTTYVETFLLIKASFGKGLANGTIRSSLTNEAVPGVTVRVRKSWNNTDGKIIKTITTNENGYYEVKDLPFGLYTIEYSKTGFVTGYKNILVLSLLDVLPQDAVISPVTSSNIYRVVLSWNADPRDLDSHVIGKLSDGTSFEVVYYDKNAYDGEVNVCNLDLDDTDGFGPETTTIKPVTNEPYYYFVHRYAGSGTVADSNAQIKLYKGDTLIKTFNAPAGQGTGDYWNVFAIVNGEIVVNNSITGSPNTSYANR